MKQTTYGKDRSLRDKKNWRKGKKGQWRRQRGPRGEEKRKRKEKRGRHGRRGGEKRKGGWGSEARLLSNSHIWPRH